MAMERERRPMEFKTCTGCNQRLPISSFYLAGRRQCKECRRAAVKAYYLANREALLPKFRERNSSAEYKEQRKVYRARAKAKRQGSAA